MSIIDLIILPNQVPNAQDFTQCLSPRCTDRHLRRTLGTLCCPLTSARGYLLSPVLCGHPSFYFHSFPFLGTLDSMMDRCIDSSLHTYTLFTFFLPIAHAWKNLSFGNTPLWCMLLERIMQSHSEFPA